MRGKCTSNVDHWEWTAKGWACSLVLTLQLDAHGMVICPHAVDKMREEKVRRETGRLGAIEHLFTLFMIIVLECIGDVLIQQLRVKCKGVRRTKK